MNYQHFSEVQTSPQLHLLSNNTDSHGKLADEKTAEERIGAWGDKPLPGSLDYTAYERVGDLPSKQ